MATARKAATTVAAHENLDAALFAVQQQMPAFQKDQVNPHFGSKYAGLETILPQVLEILGANGVMVNQFPTAITVPIIGAPDGIREITAIPGLTTEFVHVATRETKKATTPLMLGGKETAQSHAASITYMRRYGIVSALGIVLEKDEDGNAASYAPVQQSPISQDPVPVGGTLVAADGAVAGFGGAL